MYNGSLGRVFDHVAIAVSDLSASERFYRTVLSVLGVEPSHADAGLVDAGQDVVFTLTVSNAGPGDAHGVVVDDDLPSNLSWTVDDGRCSITDNHLHCALGTLAAPAEGGATTVVIHVTAKTDATKCGTVDNTGHVTSSNADSLTDDSTFTVGNNAYQVDYQGGDGNDLTLTVVP